jgi:hypothetical protein
MDPINEAYRQAIDEVNTHSIRQYAHTAIIRYAKSNKVDVQINQKFGYDQFIFPGLSVITSDGVGLTVKNTKGIEKKYFDRPKQNYKKAVDLATRLGITEAKRVKDFEEENFEIRVDGRKTEFYPATDYIPGADNIEQLEQAASKLKKGQTVTFQKAWKGEKGGKMRDYKKITIKRIN